MEKNNIGSELIHTGSTQVLKIKNGDGEPYVAQYKVRNGKVTVVDNEFLKHRCPHCGGRIIVTSKGYFCENNIGKNATCKFHCNGILSHRFIKRHEIEEFLDGNPVIIDGCFNSEGKIFSAILEESEKYGMTLTSVVGKCPGCGSDILVSPVAFNCASNQNPDGCRFKIWRHIKGYALTLQDLKELLTDGVTSHPVVLNSQHGMRSFAYLRLSEDKSRVIADYLLVECLSEKTDTVE